MNGPMFPQSMPKPLPMNLEAEQALLGAILVNNEAFGLVRHFLLPEHFHEDLHSRFYDTISSMIIAGQVASPLTVKTFFDEKELAPGFSVATYLASMAAEATTIVNARDYGRLIYELSARRRMIALANAVSDAAYSAPAGQATDVLIEQAESGLQELRSAFMERGAASSAIISHMTRLSASIADQKAGNKPPVAATGLHDLDRIIGGGLRAGRLIVLAGRPGMGKTILEASIARRLANRGFAVGIFSLEIDGEEMCARLMADHLSASRVSIAYRDILTGAVNDANMGHVQRAAKTVSDLAISIDAATSLSIAEIEARARGWREKYAKDGKRLAVIFIDYLGLVKASDRYKGRKVDELGEIVLACKMMAKRLELAVVLLAQLNRSVESRDDKRPTLSDLRDSGNIEEHADAVGLLYRPVYYLQKQNENDNSQELLDLVHAKQNDLQIVIAKNRLGPTGTVQLYCDVALSSIDNKRGL